VNRQLSFGGDGSLHLNDVDNVGIAWINNMQFKNGTIEFDVKGNDKPQGSFVGIAYHGLNDTTYECVYFRPFNFLAADPVRKSHGVQYIAVPKYDWPLLREKYPNKYEQAVLPAPDPNAWFHVRITVTPKKVSVYVNGVQKAMLEVEPLVNTGGTKIGYWVGNGSPGDWKTLKITESK
ncbi:family 16 glycoside hydrolase, partial [Mucilaginibacter sp.]|uniref:family 16 glycoside hydrolase n=1 Tax=Mucilaginibacter sp. TaxID=1882438 RepID=UPI00262342F3